MQTLQILSGVLIAIGYSIAMIGWGLLFTSILFGHRVFQAKSASDTLIWIWLGFILGQGVWGSLFLFLALAGKILPWIVYTVMIVGCVLIPALIPLLQLWQALSYKIKSKVIKKIYSLFREPSFASWFGLGLIAILFLQGFNALLPPREADAIYKYLVIPKVIAYTGRLSFQPFVPTFYGLLPLQVETH